MFYNTISVPITFCKKCKINWAKLHVLNDDENNESHEVCPKCKSYLDLTDGNDIVAYKPEPVTGRIINAETGEPHPSEALAAVSTKPRKVKVWDESYEEYQERYEKAQDDHIADYQRLFASGLSHDEAGKQAKYELVERKFHFEETNIF